jgi:hypothetical protein
VFSLTLHRSRFRAVHSANRALDAIYYKDVPRMGSPALHAVYRHRHHFHRARCLTLLPAPALKISRSLTADWATLSTPGAANNAEPADAVTQMMDLMMQDPASQQLLLSRLPPHMRKPEILRAMMGNPEVRERISSLAKSTVSQQLTTDEAGG